MGAIRCENAHRKTPHAYLETFPYEAFHLGVPIVTPEHAAQAIRQIEDFLQQDTCNGWYDLSEKTVPIPRRKPNWWGQAVAGDRLTYPVFNLTDQATKSSLEKKFGPNDQWKLNVFITNPAYYVWPEGAEFLLIDPQERIIGHCALEADANRITELLNVDYKDRLEMSNGGW